MEYIRPITVQQENSDPQVSMSSGLNMDFFVNNSELKIDQTSVAPDTEENKPKRGRPKKDQSNLSNMISANGEQKEQSAADYYNQSYAETNGMIRGALYEIDTLNQQIRGELDNVIRSKTLKNKYGYITELSESSSSLLSTKIGAIKELNSSISHIHDFELKRMRQIQDNSGNDDKQILDLYQAVIGGNVPSGSMPNMGQMMMSNNPQNNPSENYAVNMIAADLGSQINSTMAGNEDYGYANYLANKTPEQNAMVLEHNPNIETVVVYNQQTQQKYFDVIDTTTGRSIPNVPRPADIILEDTNISVANGVARNANIDQTYKLVVTGQSDSIMNY